MLNYEFKNENDPEIDVVPKSLADIHLFGINDPRVDLVEHVHQNKCVENHRIKS